MPADEETPAFNRFVPLIPKRSCRKPLGDVGDVAVQAVLVTGISSKLQSGKSAKGATPFRSLRSPGVTAEAGLYAGIVACVVLALFTSSFIKYFAHIHAEMALTQIGNVRKQQDT